MSQVAEAIFLKEGLHQSFTAAAARTAGEVITVQGGRRVAVVVNDVANGDSGEAHVRGVFSMAKATVTITAGQRAYWDATNNKVTNVRTDYPCGTFVAAVASGVAVADVDLNSFSELGGPMVCSFEFDVETTIDGDKHELIPAIMNQNGIVITGVFAVITEVMAGSSEDQGVVTVSDESDNSIATLTPTDGAADAIGDVVVGYQLHAASTGDAGKVVAAGEFVDAVVTTETSGGTPAGKMKVFVTFVPLA